MWPRDETILLIAGGDVDGAGASERSTCARRGRLIAASGIGRGVVAQPNVHRTQTEGRELLLLDGDEALLRGRPLGPCALLGEDLDA